MDQLTGDGATPKELMVILFIIEQSGDALEVGGEKESYAKIMEARSKLETLDAKIKDRIISSLVKDMDEMFASAKLIGMDLKEFRKEYNSIMKKRSLIGV